MTLSHIAADLRRAELEVGVPDSEGVSTGSTTGFRTGVGIDVHAYDAAEPLPTFAPSAAVTGDYFAVVEHLRTRGLL